jgi:hypothetical protein
MSKGSIDVQTLTTAFFGFLGSLFFRMITFARGWS